MGTVAQEFRHADRGREADALAACLDFMNDLGTFKAYKSNSWTLLNPGEARSILDVACGVGFDTIAMAKRWPKTAFVGADASARFLHIARDRAGPLDNVGFVQTDARRLPFPDAAFDGARIDRSLQHIENPAAVVRELRRVVRPGGRVVICEPDWDTFLLRGIDDTLEPIVAAKWRSLFVNSRIGGQTPSLMAGAGLTVESVQATPIVLRDYEEARRVFDIERTIDECVREGLLADADRTKWSKVAIDASTRGDFVALLCIFTVVGAS